MRIAEILGGGSQITTGSTIGGMTVGVALLHFFTTWMPFVTGGLAIIGAVLGIVWYTLMIWESETVKAWRQTRAARKKVRRLHYLKAEMGIIQAELAGLEPSPMVTVAENVATAPAVPHGTDLHEKSVMPPKD